jgi:hypothetical protein
MSLSSFHGTDQVTIIALPALARTHAAPLIRQQLLRIPPLHPYDDKREIHLGCRQVTQGADKSFVYPYDDTESRN